MKLSYIINNSLLTGMIALAMISCNEDITLEGVEAPDSMSGIPALYIAGVNGVTDNIPTLVVKESASATFTVKIPEAKDEITKINVVYDAASLDAYNADNGTAYRPVKETLVSINADLSIQVSKTESDPATLTVKSDGSLDPDSIYAVPLRISDGTSSIVLIYPVRDLTTLIDCDKGDGVKLFSVMDISQANILNNLRYTLKKSGKYMVDAVVLFNSAAGNINYDEKGVQVYFKPDEYLRYLLDHSEEYIRPLQNRGIKVILGVRCNFDRACVAGLGEDVARDLAMQLHTVCDVYGLDGVYYQDGDGFCTHDDSLPGFTKRGPEAFSRLAYEVWKLQPDKWNVVYCYSNITNSAVAIDGIESGEYIEYVLPDRNSKLTDWSKNFANLPKSRMGAIDLDCNYSRYLLDGNYFSSDVMKRIKEEGFGAIMINAMNPYKSSTSDAQDKTFTQMAIDLYDDEIVIDSIAYEMITLISTD